MPYIKLTNLKCFGIFIELCIYTITTILEYFHRPKKKIYPLAINSPSPSPRQSLIHFLSACI